MLWHSTSSLVIRLVSGRAAIYGAAEPVVGTLVGIILFHEESNFLKILGIIMVITAILLIGRSDTVSGRK